MQIDGAFQKWMYCGGGGGVCARAGEWATFHYLILQLQFDGREKYTEIQHNNRMQQQHQQHQRKQ